MAIKAEPAGVHNLLSLPASPFSVHLVLCCRNPISVFFSGLVQYFPRHMYSLSVPTSQLFLGRDLREFTHCLRVCRARWVCGTAAVGVQPPNSWGLAGVSDD